MTTSVRAADRQARDIVTIGASAGGIEALIRLFDKLPADLAATIAVVIHRPAYYVSVLDQILGRHTALRVVEPSHGDPVKTGHVYLGPRDYHMLFENSHITLNRDPQQHRMRPAVDPLFLSAAVAYGPRVVGVLLSGGGSDGVRGLIAIKAAGGVSLVQDPREARNPSMPATAIAEDDVDAVLRLDQMATVLASLTAGGDIDRAAWSAPAREPRRRP